MTQLSPFHFTARPDFALLMEVVGDAHSQAAIRVHAINTSVQRESFGGTICPVAHHCILCCLNLTNCCCLLMNSHGGGKRCKKEGCTKSAVGGSNFCTGHGGGKRCQVPGCDKSAQSSTKFCVKHGGGKKCQHMGCEKVARGRTLFCAAVRI